MNENTNTVWVRGYTADGFQISLTLAITSVQDALSKIEDIRKAGIRPDAPEKVNGESEPIAAVIRRTAADGTPLIDFYPEWKHEGKFGIHKWAHMYLNTPEDVAQFEAQSGLKLTELPEYAGESTVKRKHGQTHGCERRVKRSFSIVRIPDGEHESGMTKYRYEYAAPMTIQSAQPHWATNGGGERVAAVIREKGLVWNEIKSQIEPGKTLEKLSDTTLTEAQVMARLEELKANFQTPPRS